MVMHSSVQKLLDKSIYYLLVSCEVANCKICSEVGVCSECMKSFSLDSGSCFEISAQEVESKTGQC